MVAKLFNFTFFLANFAQKLLLSLSLRFYIYTVFFRQQFDFFAWLLKLKL